MTVLPIFGRAGGYTCTDSITTVKSMKSPAQREFQRGSPTYLGFGAAYRKRQLEFTR
jgi:hypothetical protein